MNLGLAGRTALVLASTSGLGRAVAEALAGEGAAVAVCGRRSELAVEVAAALPGGRGFFVDLSDADSVDRLLSDVVSALGPIDILVLNSGGPPASSATDTSPDDLRSSNELLLYPMQQVIRRVLPSMQAAGWGRILAIGSSGVREPIPDLALSKGREAHRYAKEIGDPNLEFLAAGGTAMVHLDLGDLEDAMRWIDNAAAVAIEPQRGA